MLLLCGRVRAFVVYASYFVAVILQRGYSKWGPISIPGPFLELGREKALASAGHMTPRISGCKNMLVSVVSVSVCINNKSEK